MLDTRIYIELLPDDAARRVLHDLCQHISPRLKGRAVDPAKWHVTILHFGVAEHVYYDILRDQPHMSRTTFLEAFKNYIDTAQKHLPPPTALQPIDLELIGLNENVLALTFEANKAVIAAHQQALSDVITFLKDCGINDPETFMKGSINFKWALELKPHITLFRTVKSVNIGTTLIPKTPLSFIGACIHGL